MGNCVICVPPDKLVAVERCGKYEGIQPSGLHVLGFDVFGICINTKSVTTRIVQNQVRCSTKTKDDVFVEFVVAVQQEVVRHKEKAEAEKILQVKSAEAEAESKFLQGQGIAKQRAAIVEGLKASLMLETNRAPEPEKVTELLLLTQFFDTLKEMSHGPATTIFMPHGPGGLGNLAEQIRSGILEGNSAAVRPEQVRMR
ncbi:unnamed protein product [Amoebophrya sp. A25]|nr:unnamed protein product [Amoebophrya sp. A25]|eukprot:GSA25T00027062001.1